jgi:predicted Zn-dependent protease with MMP-like domain
MKISRAQFDALVQAAIAELPIHLRSQINNLEIVVEDAPSEDDLIENDVPDGKTLFGLYQGVPLTERGRGYDMTLPDMITIFQQPHEDDCDTLEQLRDEVASTVRHEVAHHFGISDERLDEIGAY